MYSKPTIDTDYLAQLNKINMPENYKPEDNAWPYYQKAFELYSEPDFANSYSIIFDNPHKDFSDFNDTEQRNITDWIEQNQPAWEEFAKASLKPYCYFKYEETQETDKDDPFYTLTQILDVPIFRIEVPIGTFREIAFLCRWRVNMYSAKAHTQKAVDDSFTLLKAASHFQENKLLIVQLVGLACYSIGNEGLLKVVSENELSLRMLEDIQNRLTDMYESHPVTLNLEGERITFYDIVQHTFTKGGLGGGHLIPKKIPPLIPLVSVVITMGKLDPEPTIKERLMYLALSVLHTRRNKTIAKYNEIFEQIQKMQDMTPYEVKQSGYSTGLEPPSVFNYRINFSSFTKQSRNFLISMFTPAMGRLSELIQQKRTEYEATITILALKRYRIEKGIYPENLEDLLENGYISKLPMDPYSNKTLTYIKQGDGFKLYSVGEDFKDDGGKQIFHSNGRVIKWGKSGNKTGDAVFWPVK